MALLRLIFWVALFLVSTFVFTVLFEHGISDFPANARKELDSLRQLTAQKADEKMGVKRVISHPLWL
jgi:hypothetical protein